MNVQSSQLDRRFLKKQEQHMLFILALTRWIDDQTLLALNNDSFSLKKFHFKCLALEADLNIIRLPQLILHTLEDI